MSSLKQTVSSSTLAVEGGLVHYILPEGQRLKLVFTCTVAQSAPVSANDKTVLVGQDDRTSSCAAVLHCGYYSRGAWTLALSVTPSVFSVFIL